MKYFTSASRYFFRFTGQFLAYLKLYFFRSKRPKKAHHVTDEKDGRRTHGGKGSVIERCFPTNKILRQGDCCGG